MGHHCGGDQRHQVVGPAVTLFRCDFGPTTRTDQVGSILASEPAATTETPRGGVRGRPWNVIRVKDQKAAIEIDLERSRRHPRRSDLMARRPLGTSQGFPGLHLAGKRLLAVRAVK